MKITVELDSVEELAAVIAIIRDTPVAGDVIQQMTLRLKTSADTLAAAEAAVPQSP